MNTSDNNEIDLSGADPPVQATPEDHLLDSQGFLVPQSSPHDLPERPITVAPSSQDSVIIEDLAMSDDASDDEIGETEEISAATEENLATSAQLAASAEIIQEALPLASALKRPKQQRKKIGCRGSAKLMSLTIVPARKPTSPMIIASWKKSSLSSQPSDPANSKDSCPDNSAPTSLQTFFNQFAWF